MAIVQEVATRQLSERILRLHEGRIAVVGDCMLDQYLYADQALQASSRETGKDVLVASRIRAFPGGAGTSAKQLRALGCAVFLISVVGDDWAGRALTDSLDHLGVNLNNVLVLKHGITTICSRTIVRRQNMPALEHSRVDNRRRTHLPERILAEIRNRTGLVVPRCDALVTADYDARGEGVVHPAFVELLSDVARLHAEMPVLVDSRKRVAWFRDVIVKPNALEAASACGEELPDRIEVATVARWLYRLHARTTRPVIITAGAEGSYFTDGTYVYSCPAVPLPGAVDAVGAGGVMMATAAAALVAQSGLLEAMLIASLAAGVAVRQLRTTGEAGQVALIQAAQSLSRPLRVEVLRELNGSS